MKQYFSVKGREGKDELSEMESMLLRNEGSCKSILLPASKSLPQQKQSPESRSSEKAGTLPGVDQKSSHSYDPLTTSQRVGRQSSYGDDSVTTRKSMLPATPKPETPQVRGEIKHPQATGLDLFSDLEILDLVEGSEEDEDEWDWLFESNSEKTKSDHEEDPRAHIDTLFTMEDRSQHDLKHILNAAGSRAISIKSTFCGKPVNILVDTGCDIVCVSSRIAPRKEWKKVHNLRVCRFNGEIVNYPAKADIDWNIGGITTAWKNTWVLPAMSYDIIIGTDWMEVHDLYISFNQRKIMVGGQLCDMENVQEDLIRECTLIEASEVEALLRENKIVEIVV
jgi:hypothetical protein